MTIQFFILLDKEYMVSLCKPKKFSQLYPNIYQGSLKAGVIITKLVFKISCAIGYNRTTKIIQLN